VHPTESAPLPPSRFSVFADDESHRPAFVKYFGLLENPFRSTSDPRYLLLTSQTRQALDGLMSGIHRRAGLLVLTGEVGAGKTVLLNTLRDVLRQRGIPRAFIFNSHLETDDLFEMALAEFGVPLDRAMHARPVVRLERWLLDCYRVHSNAVLIIDEAQGLKFEVLEAIRMLLNIEPGSERLLQIVLSGQPEFDMKINLPELRQLRQRVTVRYRLGALTLEETCLYIEHRLRVAGSTGEFPFEPEALAAIHYYGRGTPRVINALSEQALMKACAEQKRPVPPKTVEEVAFQFQVDGNKPVGAPVQLGDLMMMNAVAARSKRASAMLEVSASAIPTPATWRPELTLLPSSATRSEASPDPIPLPLAGAAPMDSPPAPATPVATSAPTLTTAAADALVSPAPTPALPIAAKEPPSEPIRLSVALPSPEVAAATSERPATAKGPMLRKPGVDSRSSPARTPALPSIRKAAILALRRSKAPALSAKAHLWLLASLSSIERAVSHWLRWLREPMGYSHGTTRGRSR
jgi:general secretion pathway protein A